jgi:bud site selection protein 20
MGRIANSRRRTSKNKQYKKSVDTKRRPRDVDQIQDDLKKAAETNENISFEIDEDLPGLGQHYCVTCARHFGDQSTLELHTQTKDHKRRFVCPSLYFRVLSIF